MDEFTTLLFVSLAAFVVKLDITTSVCVHSYVCAYVYMCISVCVSDCVCCIHVCTCVYGWCTPLPLSTLPWDRVSFEPGTCYFFVCLFWFFLARLVNKPQKSCLYVGRHGHAWLFTGVLEIGIQFLMLTQQVSLPTEPSLQNLMSIWQNTYKPPWRGTSIFSLIFISVQNHFMLQLHKKSPKRAVNRKS